MPARRNATTTAAGILRPEEFARHARLERLACAADLDAYVENHWWLRWTLPEGRRHLSSTLPHPSCTLSVELGHPRDGVGDDRVILTGVVTERFDVTISGSGWVLGTKFRPGGLAAIAGLDAAALTDRTVPADGRLPASVTEPLRALTDRTAPGPAVETVESALRALLPRDPDPAYEQVLAIVGDMLADHTMVRVAQLVECHGIGSRQLQRLFARYVGVSPKWLLARYRLHDVVTALDAGYAGSLADLAAQHGWYDQAHFTRDFTALVGVPPSRYRER